MRWEQNQTDREYRNRRWVALTSTVVVVVLLALAALSAPGTVVAQDSDITGPTAAYVDEGDSGTLSFVSADGTEINTDVQVDFIGPMSDLTKDGTVEVPAIRAGNLLLVGPDGSTTVVDGSGSVGGDVAGLSIGDYDGDATQEVLYPRNDRVYAAGPSGSPAALTGSIEDGLDAVLGYGDFDGDGNPDLVFADGSQNVQYLSNFDSNGNFGRVVDTSIGIGANNGLGAGPVYDFNNNGIVRLAAIDGSQNVALFDSNANKDIIHSNYQEALKTRPGVADINADGTADVIHIGGSNNLKFGPYTGSGTPQTVTGSGGNLVPADTVAGVSGTAVGTLDAREPIVYESSIVEDPGAQVAVTFNNTVTVDDPTQATADFSVTVAGSPVAVSDVTAGAQADTLNLTLAKKVKFDESVTVSYNDSAESLGGADDGFRVEGFVDEPVTNNVSEPANFTVAISDLNTPIVAGEMLVVNATIENTGERTATQDIVLRNFTSETVDTTPLELSGGESKSVELTWQTASPDAGTGDVTVTSSNESATATLKIEGNEPDGITVETQPQETTAGANIGGPPAAKVTDQIDEPLANATVTVSTVTGGVLTGQTTADTDDSGIVVFDNVQINETGDYTLMFTVEDNNAMSDTFTVTPAAVDTIDISPATDQTTAAGEPVEFEATAFDEFGNVVETDDTAFIWTNTDATGAFSEDTVGTYDVTASLDGVTSPATTVTVEPNDVDSVELSPADDQTTAAGEPVEFDATAFDQFDNVVETDDTSFTWTNTDATGAFSEDTVGTYNVTASLDGVTSLATTVTVEPADVASVELSPAEDQTVTTGENLAFDATAFDQFGNVVETDNTSFTWTNTDATGAFSEDTVGTYNVTTSLDGVTSPATTVTVEPSNVDSVELSPATDQTTAAGEPVVFDATAFDQFGNVVETDDNAFVWGNANATGAFSEDTVGTYNVTASLDGVTSPATTVTVEPNNVDSVELSPAADQTVEAGSLLEFEATAFDEFGNVAETDDNAFVWSNTTVDGAFSEDTAGAYEVSATIDGVSSTVTVTVEPSNISSIELSPATGQTIEAGSVLELGATAFDQFGNVVEADNAAFIWTNTDSLGSFTNTSAGSYDVTASLDGVTSPATTVTVEPSEVSSVELSPSSSQTVTPDESLAFSATALDQFGNVVENNDTAFTWTNTDQTGTFSEADTGDYDVTASTNGVTSPATTVTVETSDVDSIELSPADDQTVTAGGSVTFDATAFDEFGNVVETDNGAFTWGSADSTGTFSESNAGSYSVTASLGGVTATVNVTVEASNVDSVEIAPAADQTVTAGENLAFDATAFDEFGNVVEDDDTAFTWTNTSSTGVFSGQDTGTYTVTATLNGITSPATTVTVESSNVDSVELSPADDQTVTAGESIEFHATAFDEFGNVVESDNTAFSWTNASASGTFSEDSTGAYTVSAGLDGITAAVTVTVEPDAVSSVELLPADDQTVTAGESLAFDATAFDKFDNLVETDDTAFTWTNTDPTGTFSEQTAGTYDVTASRNGVTATVTVTVEPADVDSVELSPADDQTVTTGETIEFDATALDAFGNVAETDDTAFTWTNATATGSFSEQTAGTYDVSATIDGVTATVTVTVNPRKASTVELLPADDQTVAAGESVAFEATAFDEFGNVIEDNDTAFTWSNADSTGVFSEETAGTYDVSATIDGVTATATVTVEPADVASVELSPADDQTVEAGETLPFDATALDEFGNVVADSETAFAWTNADSTGAFSEESAGTYDVSAGLNGVTATVTVTVEPADVASVTLWPADDQTVTAGASIQFHATAFDEFGNVVEEANTAFNWTNTGANGTFSKETAGTYNVVVGLSGVTAETTAVTVEPGNVSTVELTTAANQTVAAGETLPFDATAFDAFGNIVETDNAAFTWTNAGTTGVFIAETAGTYDVSASLNGVTSAVTTVTVEAADVDTVELSPADDQTVAAGEALAFDATALDAFGNVVETDQAAFDWGNTNETGVFNETAVGTYQVVASLNDETTVVTVSVEAADVDAVEISPEDDQTVEPGTLVGFEATALDAFGNVVEADDSAFTWTNATGSGVFSDEETGHYEVAASLGGVTSPVTTVTVEPGLVGSIELSPTGSQTVTAGEIVAFDATALDQYGNVIEDNDTAFTWTNANQTGIFDETTAGTYQVTADLGGTTGSATVTVEADEDPETSTVQLSPAGNQTIAAGEVVEFDATAVDQFGNVIENDDTAFAWTNTDPTGTFDETIAGTYQVTADLDGITGSVTVTVEADENPETSTVQLSPAGNQAITAGETIEFDATAIDQYGNVIEDNDTAFTWTNTDETGTFDETTAGSYQVTADLDGITGSATVTVEADEDPETSTVQLSPAGNQTIAAGEVLEFDATAIDQFGNVIEDDDTAFAWTNTDPTGTFDETTAGTYHVTADLDGSTGSAAVTVEADEDPETSTVQLSPEGQSITAGQTIEFDATATDQFGNVIEDNDTAFAWTNTDPTGTFDETTAGSYQVSADLDGITGSAAVTVEADENPETSTVQLSPAENQTIAAGETIEFDATAIDQYGNVIEDDDTAFAWTNTDPTGTFDETTAGTYDVSADLDGITGSATVTVEANDDPAGLDVTVSPDSVTVSAGTVVQFEAIALDPYGNIVESNNAAFNWTGVDPDGTFNETVAGTYVVSATLDGASDTTIVTVEPDDDPETSAVVLSPEGDKTVSAGETIVFDATAVDQFGNVIEDSDAAFAWTNASSTGIFSEEQTGSYEVSASLDSIAASTTVTVEPGDVNTGGSIELSPDSQTIVAGGSVEFNATAVDQFGNVVEDDDTAFTWTNATATGVFDETAAGSYQVTASLNGVTSGATVTVEAATTQTVELSPDEGQNAEPGETIEFSAVALDEFGNVAESNNCGFNWTNTTSCGSFTEQEPGTYDITASYQGVTAPATTVTITQPAAFLPSIQSATDFVEQDTVEVTASVTNVGDSSGTKTVELDLDGLGSREQEVALGAGESTVVTFTLETEIGDAGGYAATVQTEDGVASTNVRVFELIEILEVGVGGVNGPVEVENDIEVTLDISNVGNATANQSIVVSARGVGNTSLDIDELGPGETFSETVAIETVSQPSHIDEHEISAQLGADTLDLGTVEVHLPPLTEDSEPPTDPDSDDRYEDIDGGGELTIFDVQMLFNNLGDPVVDDHAWAYDFTDTGNDGEVNIFDIQRLFNDVGEM